MSDPLAVLLRLQLQLVVDEHRSLVSAVEEWDKAVAVGRQLRRAIDSEIEAAGRTNNGAIAAALVTWLARVRTEMARAEAAEVAAEANVGRKRISLASAQASAEAIEAEVRRSETTQRFAAAKHFQEVLDEAGLRPHPELFSVGQTF